mmetsp:Transcript_78576/g.254539  ORF Transcript_78576/g.254539 Transcript_78576/m.254539 type:complete len:246 (-) Transcript_78576:303-1040(-)
MQTRECLLHGDAALNKQRPDRGDLNLLVAVGQVPRQLAQALLALRVQVPDVVLGEPVDGVRTLVEEATGVLGQAQGAQPLPERAGRAEEPGDEPASVATARAAGKLQLSEYQVDAEQPGKLCGPMFEAQDAPHRLGKVQRGGYELHCHHLELAVLALEVAQVRGLEGGGEEGLLCNAPQGALNVQHVVFGTGQRWLTAVAAAPSATLEARGGVAAPNVMPTPLRKPDLMVEAFGDSVEVGPIVAH